MRNRVGRGRAITEGCRHPRRVGEGAAYAALTTCRMRSSGFGRYSPKLDIDACA